MKFQRLLPALVVLASCSTASPPTPPVEGTSTIAAPAAPGTSAIVPAELASKLARLEIGTTGRDEAAALLGAPNEVETDRVPCGTADRTCMTTTVKWTYFQIRNGKANALSLDRPLTLVFDRAGILRSTGGF